jgi:hypothetical protein
MLYENLSQDERRGAARFAQELLRTVPATQKPLSEEPCLFMQPAWVNCEFAGFVCNRISR